MKKTFYKESYRTVLLFARICSFGLAQDFDSKKDEDLDLRIMKVFNENNLYSISNLGVIATRHYYKFYSIFTPLLLKLNVSKMCPIYNVPGFYGAENTNPRKIYQKWCRAFDGKFTQEELEYIQQVAIKGGDEHFQSATRVWENMKEQCEWTLLKEIEHLIIYWKQKFMKKTY